MPTEIIGSPHDGVNADPRRSEARGLTKGAKEAVNGLHSPVAAACPPAGLCAAKAKIIAPNKDITNTDGRNRILFRSLRR